jgi:hypothetical protein
LKAIILSNWTSPDMRGMRSYVTSYTLRLADSELFTIHLNKQMGFYQISEFQSPDKSQNFIIEQTNRVGTPRIAAFDKESGNMLGAFKGNTLLDGDDSPMLDIKPMSKISDIACPMIEDSPEDYAGVLHGQATIGLILSRLPHPYARRSLITQLRRLTRRLGNVPRDVLEVVVVEDGVCDLRMLCAISVIMHSRGGLQLN